MTIYTAQETVAAATAAAFGRPLVQNNFRAMLVEAMIDAALPDAWTWVSADWASYDFVHVNGVRLEVKNSSARQSWKQEKPYPGKFDIRERSGRWESGSKWVAEPGRNAEVYVLAFHPVYDDSADHREPMQWRFYVVPTSALPPDKTISLSRVRTLAQPCGIQELAGRIEAVAHNVQPPATRRDAIAELDKPGDPARFIAEADEITMNGPVVRTTGSPLVKSQP